MGEAARSTLRATAPWRVLDGFGYAVRAACRYARPGSVEELAAVLAEARAEGLRVTFRGAGRSYGDAALNRDGLVVDVTGMRRVLSWDPRAGILDAEAGLAVEGLWRHTIEDGFWPAVVPGTMYPTLGGCLAMNVHGKNNFQVGPFGEHVIEFDLLTADGAFMRCSREQNADVFHAAIGGMGLLGAMTRVKLRLKHVHSGQLRVEPILGRSIDEMIDVFEARLATSDYLVGWVDCFAGGASLGRGAVHAASYLAEGRDPDPTATLRVGAQGLPPRILGFPRDHLWKLMRPFTNDAGVALVNYGKFLSSHLEHGRPYRQSHVQFAFLLDYVANWRLAYGRAGFVQHQIFVPRAEARACIRDVLALCRRTGVRSYLGVLKRHRPDAFLMSHALDGYSLAMDFPARDLDALRRTAAAVTARVLEAGGKFYFAKDALIGPGDVERAYGRETLDRFAAMRRRLDPGGLFTSDLARRVLGG